MNHTWVVRCSIDTSLSDLYGILAEVDSEVFIEVSRYDGYECDGYECEESFLGRVQLLRRQHGSPVFRHAGGREQLCGTRDALSVIAAKPALRVVRSSART